MFLFLAVLSCTISAEEPQARQSEKPGKDATLQVVAISKSMFGVDLTNNVPVQGIQFTLRGVTIAEVKTTSRSEKFFASFNSENGIVILASLSADKIPPGKGLIAEIVSTGSGSASLSEIKIVK